MTSTTSIAIHRAIVQLFRSDLRASIVLFLLYPKIPDGPKDRPVSSLINNKIAVKFSNKTYLIKKGGYILSVAPSIPRSSSYPPWLGVQKNEVVWFGSDTGSWTKVIDATAAVEGVEVTSYLADAPAGGSRVRRGRSRRRTRGCGSARRGRAGR